MAVLHRHTLGNVFLLQVDANPNGSINAALGSLATDSTNGKLYINTDGVTTWVELGAASSSGASVLGDNHYYIDAGASSVVTANIYTAIGIITTDLLDQTESGAYALFISWKLLCNTGTGLPTVRVRVVNNGSVNATTIYALELNNQSGTSGASYADSFIVQIQLKPGSNTIILEHTNASTTNQKTIAVAAIELFQIAGGPA